MIIKEQLLFIIFALYYVSIYNYHHHIIFASILSPKNHSTNEWHIII